VPYDLQIITVPVSNCRLFSNVNISQGSVATRIRCGGIFSYHFAAVCKFIAQSNSERILKIG